MALSEFQLIEQYFSNWNIHSAAPSQFDLGVGDDCALMSLSADKQLAMSVDTFVEGTHFPDGWDADLIASRVLRASVSDLAAVGAIPVGFTLALTMPSANEAWIAQFAKALYADAKRFSIPLIGGDTTRGPLTISIQVMGEVDRDKALLRGGAQAGDDIYVTGSLGDSAAGLHLMTHQTSDAFDHTSRDYLLSRFSHPTPRLDWGLAIRGYATSAIDISDGLLADLSHILASSQDQGALLFLNKVPVSGITQRYANMLQSSEQSARDQQNPTHLNLYQQWALSGGEDFELCFTVPRSHQQDVEMLALQAKTPIHKIGRITQEAGIRLQTESAQIISLDELSVSTGFRHF